MTKANSAKNPPFYVKDCSLASIATGIKSQTLAELRDRIALIKPSSIYYHFWGGRLRTSFGHREYHNDFARWAHSALHDDILAERLDLIDPTNYENLEVLRQDLIGIIQNRLEELEYIPWAKSEEQFYFVESKIIVFSTTYLIQKPEDVVKTLPLLSPSSIFYHWIDAARRLPEKIDDFTAWLSEFGDQYKELQENLRKIDPYFISLPHLQEKIAQVFINYFVKSSGEP